jgi:hypothetical protein
MIECTISSSIRLLEKSQTVTLRELPINNIPLAERVALSVSRRGVVASSRRVASSSEDSIHHLAILSLVSAPLRLLSGQRAQRTRHVI